MKKSSPFKDKHPLKALRESGSLTMDQVAAYVGMSKQYIVRVEQGVYAECPVGYLTELLEMLIEYDVKDAEYHDAYVISEEYRQWQGKRRRASYGQLIADFDWHSSHGSDNTVQHPFVHWRTHSGLNSRISISKLFCVHPALITKFENTPWLCTSPPGELLEALRESGYHLRDIEFLCFRYEQYRKARRGVLEAKVK